MLKRRIGINAKMIFMILSVTAIIYALSVAYVTVNMKRMSLKNSKKIANSFGKEYANLITSELNKSMDISRAMSHAFMSFRDKPLEERKDYYLRILKKVAEENPNFVSVWLSKELNDLYPDWSKEHGRFRFNQYRGENNEVINKVEIIDTVEGGLYTAGSYYKMKAEGLELMTNPYPFSYNDKSSDTILMTSACIPLMHNGKFTGLTGVDISLSKFEEIINKIDVYKDDDGESHGYAFLLSNNGTLVTHPDKIYIGKKFQDIDSIVVKENNIIEKIVKGKHFNFDDINEDTKKKRFVTFTPIKIGNSAEYWSLATVLNYDAILKEANQKFRTIVIISIACLILLALLVWFIAHRISKPLIGTTNTLKSLAIGDINRTSKLKFKSKDEIGEMALSVNTVIDGLKRTADFSAQIGEGNLDSKFTPLSDKDVLGNSLLKMRKSLKDAKKEEERRKVDDEKRNWATQGLAKFGDILRLNNDSIENLTYEIIHNMVKYLDAKVGGIFILNNENQDHLFLEMKAFFAYDRKKKAEKTIEIGEGLIGSCFKEKRTIKLDKIPDGYMAISSGLGETQPKSILNVPMINNEDIYGVIELASLNNFESYQIEFIEKVCENIAATISTVKTNIKTSELLHQSRLQSEQLRAQEEEMRQNMEELHATQEEISRKNAEMEGIIEAVNVSNFVIYYDLDGIILDFNDAYLKRFNIKDKSNIIGSHHSDNMNLKGEQKEEYDKFWNDLREGKIQKYVNTLLIGDKTYWFDETYTPIKDNSGKPFKIMKIANDITESKLAEKEFNEKLQELNELEIKLKSENSKLKDEVKTLRAKGKK